MLGHVHYTGKILGQGGQGMVIRTRDPDLALKIVPDASGDEPESDPAIVERHRRRYAAVRRMPVPQSCHITIPMILLCDAPGYVMQLMAGLSSMSDLWPNGSSLLDEIPEWLSKINESSPKAAKILFYYSRSGGLRRRLAIGSRCASELARLHARSLIYGDISENNVYISPDLVFPDVWLIDADNISYEREQGGMVVYTPTFGAPELVQGKGACTPATDCYAYAVCMFKILTLVHPFLGRAATADDSDWADTDINEEVVDGEQRAYRGELPWIDDPDDDSNNLDSFALPRNLVLTPQLNKLFEETFCAGRLDPARRPVIWHWAEAFAKAADSTLACKNCHMTYYASCAEGTGCCPYCGEPVSSYVSVRSFRWLGTHTSLHQVWQFVRELLPGKTVQLPARVFVPFDTSTTGDSPMLFFTSEVGEDVYRMEFDSSAMEHERKLIIENSSGGSFEPLGKIASLPKSHTRFKILYNSEFPYIIEFSIHHNESAPICN